MKIPGRRQARKLLERTTSARLRLFVFRIAARVLPSQVGAGVFLGLAAEFAETGRVREARTCWRILHRMAPRDTKVFMKRVSSALEAGDAAEIDRTVEDSFRTGISPQLFVRVAGLLAQHGFMDSAGRAILRLSGMPGGRRHVTQSPSIVSAGIPDDIRALGTHLISGDRMSPEHLLPLARLSFSFRDPATAAALFANASKVVPLGALDRIAMLHGLASEEAALPQDAAGEMRGLMEEVGGNPDALGMLAKIALVAGEPYIAREAVVRALRERFGDPGDDVVADCLAMVEVLVALRGVDSRLPAPLLERRDPGKGGVPKIFLCGFGWSGSGALYDGIRGAPGLCEFEGAGRDEIINEDADTEVMFVQGPGGLGDLWLRALDRRRISWNALWDTFTLHAAGLSPIGYAQYKSSAAAQNHVRRYGGLYTRPFRRFLEGYAALRRNPRPGALHACLVDATESLCRMLVGEAGGRAVVFNNAIFGRNAPMLELFHTYRAAVVYRDPRDVYVDRRDKDLNHWRSPRELASYYAHGLHRYMLYKSENAGSAPDVREVPFERFVNDEDFRSRVRDWLLGELSGSVTAGYFDPVSSRRNIGIHAGQLTSVEQAQLRAALDDCRALDQLSAAAWDAAG